MSFKTKRLAWEVKNDKSVLGAYVMVACCQRFFVNIEHLTIVPNLANVDLMICSDVEIGISVTLIDRFRSNLKKADATRGLNEIGIFTARAQFVSSYVVNPNQIIFNIYLQGLA